MRHFAMDEDSDIRLLMMDELSLIAGGDGGDGDAEGEEPKKDDEKPEDKKPEEKKDQNDKKSTFQEIFGGCLVDGKIEGELGAIKGGKFSIEGKIDCR